VSGLSPGPVPGVAARRPRVALATCRELPDLEADDQTLLPELAALGVDAEPAVWDDAGVDWPAYDLVVVRDTWDYTDRREAFLAWAYSVPRLVNPAPALHWNTDKRYLGDLAEAGSPVVPTRFVTPGQPVRLPADGEFVVKPTVSAGSRDTGRYRQDQIDLALEHGNRLLAAGRTVMIQPYLAAVDSYGETALLYFGGIFSHAIRKGPLLAGPYTGPQGLTESLYRLETITPRTPSADERRVADWVLANLPDVVGEPADLMYARVDLVPGSDGSPLLLELEITEPSMFLADGEGAAFRFAETIRDAAYRHASAASED
jgi:glutathione synthase/RimK-type ligase-like ATP-grasp enzyme